MIKALRRHTASFLDCHFAVVEPAKYVQRAADAGADMFTFHLEAADGPEAALSIARSVREAGMAVGVAIKPDTALDGLLPLLEQVRGGCFYFEFLLVRWPLHDP